LEAASEVDEKELRVFGIVGTYGKPVVRDFGIETRSIDNGL
jgi:hypothetical protein